MQGRTGRAGRKALDAKAAKLRLKDGLAGALGFSLVSAAKGRVRLRMPHHKAATQPYGLFHGGAIASLCDTAAGIGSLLLLPEGSRAVTSELKINYLGNSDHGALVAEAKLLHHGRRTLVWEVRAWKEGSRDLLAVVLTTFFVLPPETAR